MEVIIIYNLMYYATCLIIGYLLGSIPFALIIGKLVKNIDVRNFGSGNLGGTNVCRTIGFKWGIFVIFFDILKGFLATTIGYLLEGHTLAIILGICAIIGHAYPVLAKFKGGKGVATGAGIFIFLAPIPTIISLIIFIITLIITKYVSLSSIIAIFIGVIAILLPFFKINFATQLFAIISAIFIIYKHKKNIKNLLRGKENKIKK